MGENDKKSVSDERSFLKGTVSIRAGEKLLFFSSFERLILRKILLKGG